MTGAPAGRRRSPTAAAVAVLAAMAVAGCAASTTTTPGTPAGAPPVARAPLPPPAPVADDEDLYDPLRIADQALRHEDRGDYGAALASWKRLRPRAPADADLELATALAEARIGALDSAAVRLAGPLLSAAADDTLPVSRYRFYRPRREGQLVNGAFDGWHWYVWRARAEVAARRGRWADAAVAARRCVAARPTSGKEWLLLAVSAGRAGREDEARAAARQAVLLDAGVPEARYLAAVWEWRDGRRAAAQAGFEAAVALDPSFQPGVSALARSRLPGAAPDTLPTALLTGARAVGLLTSPLAPKLEETARMDQVPIASERPQPQVPDSLRAALGNGRLPLWLFIDEGGRVALAELAWYPSGEFPTPLVAALVALLPDWRFTPAQAGGAPRGVWAEIRYSFPR